MGIKTTIAIFAFCDVLVQNPTLEQEKTFKLKTTTILVRKASQFTNDNRDQIEMTFKNRLNSKFSFQSADRKQLITSSIKYSGFSAQAPALLSILFSTRWNGKYEFKPLHFMLETRCMLFRKPP